MGTRVRFLMCLCLGMVVVVAATGEDPPPAPLELHPLRDECVRIGVMVETPALTYEQIFALDKEVDLRFPSIFYAGDSKKGYLSVNFWLAEQAKAILLLSKKSTQPPEDWTASVSVNWRDLDRLIQDANAPIAERLKAEDRARRIALERPARLGWIVMPEKEATLGDAFQTLADLLGIEVTATWRLTESYAPTWERLLELPLEATDVQCQHGMTLQALIDCVAQRLGGDAVINDEEKKLLFDDLLAEAIDRQNRFDWLFEKLDKKRKEAGESGVTTDDEEGPGEEEGEVVTDEEDAEGE